MLDSIFSLQKKVSNTQRTTHNTQRTTHNATQHNATSVTFLILLCVAMNDGDGDGDGDGIRKCISEFKHANTHNQGQNTDAKSHDAHKYTKKCFAKIPKQFADEVEYYS